MPIDEAAKQLIVEAVKDTEMSENLVVAVEKYIGNDENVRLINCRYEDYSKDKLGFSSAYKKLEITLQKSNADEPRTMSFFVKSRLSSFNELIDAMSTHEELFKETNFYSTIVPLLEKNCKTEKWHAKCYLANKSVIVMEDLRSQGYKLFGDKVVDDMAGLKSVLVALARLHGSSIIAEDRLNSNSEKAVTLKELYPVVLDDAMFTQDTITSAWYPPSIELVCVIAEHLNDDPDKIRRSCEKIRNLVEPSKIHRNVVCHGDLWGNNFMFRDGFSAIRECILLDFQFVRYAPLAIDLLQLLHLNATRIFREKYAKELVEFYRCALEETIRDNDSTAKVPDLRDILVAMEDLRLVGLCTAVLYFPIIWMGSEAVAELAKDDDSFLKFMFQSRTEQALAHMEVNEAYKSKIYEAVIELLEYNDEEK